MNIDPNNSDVECNAEEDLLAMLVEITGRVFVRMNENSSFELFRKLGIRPSFLDYTL